MGYSREDKLTFVEEKKEDGGDSDDEELSDRQDEKKRRPLPGNPSRPSLEAEAGNVGDDSSDSDMLLQEPEDHPPPHPRQQALPPPQPGQQLPPPPPNQLHGPPATSLQAGGGEAADALQTMQLHADLAARQQLQLLEAVAQQQLLATSFHALQLGMPSAAIPAVVPQLHAGPAPTHAVPPPLIAPAVAPLVAQIQQQKALAQQQALAQQRALVQQQQQEALARQQAEAVALGLGAGGAAAALYTPGAGGAAAALGASAQLVADGAAPLLAGGNVLLGLEPAAAVPSNAVAAAGGVPVVLPPPIVAPSPQVLPPYVPPTPATLGQPLPFLALQDRPLVPPVYNGINPAYPGARLLHAHPPIYAVAGFLTPAECDFLIAAANDSFGPAPVVGKGSGEVSSSRTSSTCYLAREDLPEYLRKVGALTGKPTSPCELPQVGRYLPSQQYLQHFDAFDLGDEDGRRFAANGGQRTVTVLVYLNDVPRGGSTSFPSLGLEVQPVRGTAIVFFPATLDGLLDRSVLHAAQPAVDVKYVSQVWIRQGNYDGRPSKRLMTPMVAGLQERREAAQRQAQQQLLQQQHYEFISKASE